MSARAQGLLNQHPMTTCLPGVKPLINPPSDCLGYGDMSGYFQDNRLKDNEPLQVPQYVPYPKQLFHQSHHKVSPNLPTWLIVYPGEHDHKVISSPLTSLIFTSASMKESAMVGVNSVPVDLLESEVIWGRVVAHQIDPLSPPVFLIRQLVAPALLFLLAGIRLGRSGEVTGWSFHLPSPPARARVFPTFILPCHPLPFLSLFVPFVFLASSVALPVGSRARYWHNAPDTNMTCRCGWPCRTRIARSCKSTWGCICNRR